jgi:8-oxo-dGTP pyrophosphatase MutT (NUDIX family)
VPAHFPPDWKLSWAAAAREPAGPGEQDDPLPYPHMTRVSVSIVDVYPVRQVVGRLQVLVLRRSEGTRCTGAWETVHGHIESGESPVAAARRELQEETGLVPERWYNLSRVETFYQHRSDEVAVVPVFVAIIGSTGRESLSAEHDASEWLALDEAAGRLAWPRERRALEDIVHLLAEGTANRLDDVLRIG